MAPTIESVASFSILDQFNDQFDPSWKGEHEPKNNLARRNLNVNAEDSHSSLSAGKITAIVATIILVVLGLLSLGIYIYRRRLQSRKNDILRKVQYLGSPSKKDQDLSNSDTKSTFVVALPRSSKGTTGQNVTIGIGNDKPRVLYAMSGEDPSSAPLKRGGNGLHNTPTLKIDTSTLTTPPTQGHSLSPLPSPRTAASKSPGRFSMSPSMKSETLYKLVVVESTFPPSLTDELEIQLGEHLHLIEEYEDEWCLVQRIGSKEKGVIPRLCISEKDRSPSTKSRSVFRFSAQAIAASKASAI